jgi:O-antigen/teichoic acid export membrane protein
MANRLRYNIGWTLFGNTVFAATQWAIIVLIARVGSPEMVGSYALALAITAPVFMLANLNLRAYQATDIQDEFQFSQYLAVRLVTSAIAMCVVAGLGLLGIVQAAHVTVVLAVGSAKVFETISDATYGLFQRHEELDLIARSLMLRGCLGFVGMAGGLVIGGSLTAGAIGMATAWLLVMASVDMPRSRHFVRWPGLWLGGGTFELIRQAAPLGLVMMMVAVSQNLPAYVIEYALGTEQLGFYASVAYFLIAGRIVSNAVSQSSSPRLARFLAQGDVPGFRRLLHLNLLLGLGLGVAGVLISALFGERLLDLVYGHAYARYDLLLICTMATAGLGFPAAFLGAALTAARRFRAMVAVNVLSLAATGLLCWWAIPLFGLLGAPLAIGIAFLLKVTVNMMVIEQFLQTVRPDLRAGDEHV